VHERDVIFREKLIALMAALNGGEGRDRTLRRTIGTFSDKLAKEAGARNWADLKERADGPTYDSLLQLFGKQSEQLARQGDAAGVRALEVLSLSLIARRQYQADLFPGVDFLDRYIEECAQNARRAGAQILPVKH
jgi:hypothetical protein